MAQQAINIGTVANDGTGDTLRSAGNKINENFYELYQTTYTAAVPSNWNGTAPTTVGDALDRLAVVVKSLNGGTGA